MRQAPTVPVAYWGTYRGPDRGTYCGANWGTVIFTYRGHKQPVRKGPTGEMSTVHTEGIGNQLGRGQGLGPESTDNQTDRGPTQWGTLTHGTLYRGPHR